MAIIRANRPLTAYRRAYRPYATAIGQLVYMWNSLHHVLAKLFELTIKSPNPRTGMAIWYSTDSDYSQRKMLRAAVEKATQLTDTQRKGVLWALNTIDDSLRHARNDAIHAPLAFLAGAGKQPDKVLLIANPTSASPRAQSLWKRTRDDLSLLDHLRDQTKLVEVLSDYINAICNSILAPAIHSWPDKPKLPQAHRTKGKPAQNTGKSRRRPSKSGQ